MAYAEWNKKWTKLLQKRNKIDRELSKLSYAPENEKKRAKLETKLRAAQRAADEFMNNRSPNDEPRSSWI